MKLLVYLTMNGIVDNLKYFKLFYEFIIISGGVLLRMIW